MKILLIIFMVFIDSSCKINLKGSERDLFLNKIEAFQFLSDYHDQLHIMIGEEDGDIRSSYDQFNNAIHNNNNNELLPIKKAFERIDVSNLNPNDEKVKRLDYLVDYYQSGLSMQIEGIFKGYGYLDLLDMETVIETYDKISQNLELNVQ